MSQTNCNKDRWQPVIPKKFRDLFTKEIETPENIRAVMYGEIDPLDLVKTTPNLLCPTCYKIFCTPVWHCLVCDSHWELDLEQCNHCHADKPSWEEATSDNTIMKIAIREDPTNEDAIRKDLQR
mgnify:CR=1 FL=1